MLPEALTPSPAVILVLVSLPLYFAPVIIRAIQSSSGPIYHLVRTSSRSHVDLPCTPNRRFSSMLTVLFSMVLLGLKHLGFGRKFGKVQSDGTVQLPALSISAPLTVNKGEVAAYHRAVSPGPRSLEAAPSNTPILIPAPLTTSLIPSLFLLRANPVRPLGSVNVRNVFVFHRPDVLRCAGTKAGEAGEMRVEAKMGGVDLPGRRKKRGIEFDTVITVHPGSRTSEDPEPIFSLTFTTLSLIRLPPSSPFPQQPSSSLPNPESKIIWHDDLLPLSLPSDSTPMPWASLSKDYNPIHVSPLLAKLFGFKKNIAHGNMVLAMVMLRATSSGDKDHSGKDAIPPRAQLGHLWAGSPDSERIAPSWLIVEFKRPVFVPSTPKVRWSDGRVQVYEVGKRAGGDKPDGEEEVRVLVDIRAGEGVDPPA